MLHYMQLKQNTLMQREISKSINLVKQDTHNLCKECKWLIKKYFNALDRYGIDIDGYVVVFDIDETLINNDDFALCYGDDKIRQKLAENEYGGYNASVYGLYLWLKPKLQFRNLKLYIVTRREEKWREKTEENLKMLGINYDKLIFTDNKPKIFGSIVKHFMHIGDQELDLYDKSFINVRLPSFYVI